jgi:hypothetical protein
VPNVLQSPIFFIDSEAASVTTPLPKKTLCGNLKA